MGLNIEADEKSAYNNVQVGVGLNTENFEKKFYRQCRLAGPNKEADEKSAYNNVLVGRRNKFCENIISVPLPYA